MESKKSANLFEKFRVAELKRPEYIIGGGDGDDDGTLDTGKKKGICVEKSKRYVAIEKDAIISD